MEGESFEQEGLKKFSDLEDWDMSFIQNIPWAEQMYKKLQAGLQKAFLNWCKYVLNLASGQHQIDDWSSLYTNLVEQTLCGLVYEMACLQDKVLRIIEELLKELQSICTDLKIEMPIVGSENLSLYQEHAQLKKLIIEYGALRDARKQELDNLKKKQTQLCKYLGKEPMLIKEHPLPSANEVEAFQKHIEKLEAERFEREEHYFVIKDDICNLVDELKIDPSTEFERQVVFGKDQDFSLTGENMRQLDYYHRSLKREVEKAKEEAARLRHNIEELWNILEVDIIDREEFKSKFVGHSLSILEGLREEHKRCKELKKANIQVFVEKLRKELEELWEMCHCGGKERNEFQFMYSDCYTEDLLELHEVEVARWTKYHKENVELLDLLNKHKRLWDRLVELEENATGPNRYKNRGGQLLKEEKERNGLAKKIPKMEEDLRNLASLFYERTNADFKTYGHTIEEYISALHEERTHQKQLKLSARKQQRDQTMLTPAKFQSNLFPSTSTSCLRTPASATKRKFAQTPSTDVKKPKREETPRSVLRQRNIPTNIKIVTGRLSMEKKKKRASRSNKLAGGKRRLENINADTTTSTEYNDFENEISSRTDIRSTILPISELPSQPQTRSQKKAAATKVRSTHVTPTPHGTTPKASASNRKTPQTTPKSPGGTNKFTTCKSNLKLIF